MNKDKAFINHKANGVFLTFPNGNSLSTVWGFGNYCENYNHGDFEKTNNGSNDCEIYPDADEKTLNKIKSFLPQYKDNYPVAGYVTMSEWLKVIKILSK